jgi:hypothetical protein
MPTGEGYLKSVIDIDIALYAENETVATPVSELDFLLNMIHFVIDHLFKNCNNVVRHDSLVRVLLSTSMSLKTQSLFASKKKRHTLDRIAMHMLGLVSKLGCVSDGLYLALYLYDTARYQTALAITERVKEKLSQSHIMYGSVNIQRYSEAVGGQSMLTRYRKAWARNIKLSGEFAYIEELRLEQEVRRGNEMYHLHLSPFVTVHMLSVLCHYRLGNRSQYLQALTDLHTLLLYDDGRCVPLHQRDLSWQILGICQHVVGDLNGALQSFHESLTEESYNKIQTATEYRISLVSKECEDRSCMMN